MFDLVSNHGQICFVHKLVLFDGERVGRHNVTDRAIAIDILRDHPFSAISVGKYPAKFAIVINNNVIQLAYTHVMLFIVRNWHVSAKL